MLGSVFWAATCARQYRLRCYGPGPLGPGAPLKGAGERRRPLGQGGSVGREQPSSQLRAQGMEGLQEVDVSRLSVAECLALAEKQDEDREEAAAPDPVEGILANGSGDVRPAANANADASNAIATTTSSSYASGNSNSS